MTRLRKARSRTSPGHPKRARRSSVRWIGFRRRPGAKKRPGRVGRKSPARAGAARLGSRPADRRGRSPGMVRYPQGGRLPGMVRYRQGGREGQRMRMGRFPSLRGTAARAPLPLRRQSSVQRKRMENTSCRRSAVPRAILRPRHLSVTWGIQAPRLPRRRRRHAVERPPTASRPARHRRKRSPRGRHERSRRSRRLEPHRRPARRPLCREAPALPRRRPERKTSLPARVRMTRPTPTRRQST